MKKILEKIKQAILAKFSQAETDKQYVRLACKILGSKKITFLWTAYCEKTNLSATPYDGKVVENAWLSYLENKNKINLDNTKMALFMQSFDKNFFHLFIIIYKNKFLNL